MYLADSRHAPASDDAAPAPRPGRPARIAATVLALGTVSLVTDVSSEMVTAVLPLYLVTALHVSPLGFGVLDGVYNGATVVVRLLGGLLADRPPHGAGPHGAGPDGTGAQGWGRHKAVAAAGYGLSALCKPALLLARTTPVLGLVLAVDRVGKGLRTAPRDALISLATPPERRARAFGVHRAMDTAGALAGPLLAFLVLRAAPGGYHAVFTVSACVAALGVLVLVLFVPRHPAGTAPLTAVLPAGRPVAGLLRLPGLRRVTLCAALLGLATLSDSFVYLLAQRRLDLPTGWFPLLPLGTAAVYLLLAVPLGAAGDRFGRRRVFVLGHLALLGGYAVLLLRPAGGAAPACAVLALHGLFYAATDGMLAAATASAVPAAQRGAGLALVGTGQAAGRFGCSLAVGVLWARWGDGAALAVVAGALVGAVVLAARVLGPGGGAEPAGDGAPADGCAGAPADGRGRV
ncbi:MFS transporter [Kitasatospora sp. NPDC048538]|uniref:MFS transporter n=1 Tax=unclassified Kitasatospora TaxID=2633591 RepID=UPI0033EDC53A